MSRDPSPDIDTVDQHSLEAFTGELIDAGFNPVGNGVSWTGPIDPAFAKLTDATSMRIEIRDGWPFRHPKLFVDGLGPHLHLNDAGDVCLWTEGDACYNWLTLDGFRKRIGEWCATALGPPGAADPGLDAHLYFKGRSPLLATLDFAGLVDGGFIQSTEGRSGELGATIDDKLVRIAKDGPVPVRWYFLRNVSVPPSSLEAIDSALSPDKSRNLSRALKRLTGQLVVLLFWSTPRGSNVLAVLATKTPQGNKAEALQVGLTDQEVLKLRAGPDLAKLAMKRVALFGLGAIGSHIAVLLAKSGVGVTCLFDDQVLRPADVARHAASRLFVGKTKAEAVQTTIGIDSPWAKSRSIVRALWEPEQIETAISGMDLVVEATGSRAFAEQLGVIVGRIDPTPALLSIALYRGGAVSRARVQLAGARPLHERTAANGFPIIPSGDGDEAIGWEPGCGAPINNAPPTSVASAAALAARTAVDVLVGRSNRSEDIYETYLSLDDDGFRELGRYSVPV